jgi:hypothetical protein
MAGRPSDDAVRSALCGSVWACADKLGPGIHDRKSTRMEFSADTCTITERSAHTHAWEQSVSEATCVINKGGGAAVTVNVRVQTVVYTSSVAPEPKETAVNRIVLLTVANDLKSFTTNRKEVFTPTAKAAAPAPAAAATAATDAKSAAVPAPAPAAAAVHHQSTAPVSPKGSGSAGGGAPVVSVDVDDPITRTDVTTCPVDAGARLPSDLVELTDRTVPGVRLDIRYASTRNFTGHAVYSQARAFLQRPVVEALARVQSRLLARRPVALSLMVFDGYRPWSVTRTFWDSTPDRLKKFVADPKTGSKHNRVRPTRHAACVL